VQGQERGQRRGKAGNKSKPTCERAPGNRNGRASPAQSQRCTKQRHRNNNAGNKAKATQIRGQRCSCAARVLPLRCPCAAPPAGQRKGSASAALPLGSARAAQGQRCPCAAHALPLRCPCAAFALPLRCPCVALVLPLCCPCAALVLPLCCCCAALALPCRPGKERQWQPCTRCPCKGDAERTAKQRTCWCDGCCGKVAHPHAAGGE
jgi:hypothetical protein